MDHKDFGKKMALMNRRANKVTKCNLHTNLDGFSLSESLMITIIHQ